MTAAGPLADAPTVLVTAVGAAEGARPAAGALACAGASSDRAALLVDFGGRPPRPTLLTSVAARQLEERLAAHLPRTRVAARGQICQIAVGIDAAGLEAGLSAVTVARGALAALYAPPPVVQGLLEEGLGSRLSGVLLRADLGTDRALTALVVRALRRRELAVGVLKRRLPWVAERRALFGTLAPGAAGSLPESLLRRLADPGLSRDTPEGMERVQAAAGAEAAW